jgi:hypothetical protein
VKARRGKSYLFIKCICIEVEKKKISKQSIYKLRFKGLTGYRGPLVQDLRSTISLTSSGVVYSDLLVLEPRVRSLNSGAGIWGWRDAS